MKISTILLWLFVINLGIGLGAGLYESRIVVPRWVETGEWNAQAAQADNTGLRFWVYITTGPLTLLTLANLIVAWRSRGPVRVWWLAASLFALADRAFTFSYFIPTMVKLMQDQDLSGPVALSTFSQWMNLNYLRHAIVIAALLAALKAFALFYKTGNLRASS
jgi:hypothetical protein